MVKILVFDTETTDKGPVGGTPGLQYKEKQLIERALVEKDPGVATTYWRDWIERWPHITQLSYIIYNTDNPADSKIFNKYIDLPPEIEIANGASKVTRVFTNDEDVIRKNIIDEETGQLITPDTPNIFVLSRMKIANPERFALISNAVDEFMADLKSSDYIVAHNIDFDKKMILAELVRLGRDADFYGILAENNFICTMMRSIQVCRLEKMNKFGKMEYKWPQLKEAYKTLFGYQPTGKDLHNAIIDVVVCLRVFCKLGPPSPFDFDVCGTNDEITKLINSISPPEFKCPVSASGGKKQGQKLKKRKNTKKMGGKLRRSKRLHKRL
jgi:DNA polymerase III epsilon subunit-like protein